MMKKREVGEGRKSSVARLSSIGRTGYNNSDESNNCIDPITLIGSPILFFFSSSLSSSISTFRFLFSHLFALSNNKVTLYRSLFAYYSLSPSLSYPPFTPGNPARWTLPLPRSGQYLYTRYCFPPLVDPYFLIFQYFIACYYYSFSPRFLSGRFEPES